MSNKPEIFLEIGAGFFRIPTSEANYNITLLPSQETSVTRVVEKIVEKEKQEAALPEQPNAAAELVRVEGEGDDYYREVSSAIYRDIGQLAKKLSVTIMDIPAEDRLRRRAELDEAGDKIEDAKNQLKDIVEMTEKAAMRIMDKVEDVQGRADSVRELLSALKQHPAFAVQESGGEVQAASAVPDQPGPATEGLQHRIGQALELISAMQQKGAPEAAPEVSKERKTRYLFEVDVVFQTLYELCTNETVKEHLAKARARAGEVFVTDKFRDAISAKAVNYQADSDHFFTAPMTDVFTALFKACRDKGIANLLKKMDAGQGSIFLDQNIPLPVPPTEEIEVEVASPPAAAVSGPADPSVSKVKELLEESRDLLAALPEEYRTRQLSSEGRPMTLEDQREIFQRIEDAFDITSTISSDVAKIAESLSFQDLSGQQIMKIIKLLSDFQIQLLALVVSFGSQLKQKEINKDITAEESKKLAQDDVDNYIAKLSDRTESGGVLDQETVNRMLEDMGF